MKAAPAQIGSDVINEKESLDTQELSPIHCIRTKRVTFTSSTVFRRILTSKISSSNTMDWKSHHNLRWSEKTSQDNVDNFYFTLTEVESFFIKMTFKRYESSGWVNFAFQASTHKQTRSRQERICWIGRLFLLLKGEWCDVLTTAAALTTLYSEYLY